MNVRTLTLASIALLLALAAFAAPPFDDRWNGEGYRPEPQAAIPGITEDPHWMIFATNADATAWLAALDASMAEGHTMQWHSHWRHYHPTDNRVAIQIRCEENKFFTVAEFAEFIADPLPAEWWTIP